MNLPIGSAFIEVVSAWIPPGKMYMVATNLSDEDHKKIAELAERYEAEGATKIEAHARALVESGKVAVLHCAPDVMPKDPP